MTDFWKDVASQVYEITWMSGHVETVIAHQVSYKTEQSRIAALGSGQYTSESTGARIQFHAEVDERWTLQLSALDADIRTIRNITKGEQAPGGELS
jgi:hypothetical protein